LIVGPSGSGKSSLAVQIIAFGARLVADDQCDLRQDGDAVIASRPTTLPDAIEARGLGLIKMPPAPEDAQVVAVLDVTDRAEARMPARQFCKIGQVDIPRLQNPASAHGPASLYLYLMYGLHD